ncbi:MAG: DUF6519 domain-containing protein [Pyrinomonadaceae bacterium]
MRGDFSAWNKDRSRNFRGTLHQQGRVLLDRDWNAQTDVFCEWQESAARDAFGAGVAAIPAEEPDGFKVTRAKNVAVGGNNPAHVEIGLRGGRVWADGMLAELSGDVPPPNPLAWPGTDAVRTATYLGPPIQAAPPSDAIPANGDRDAVILETWLEELSPFQEPDLLIEPALGGVDTTERVLAAYRLRLYRMAVGDTCDSIIDKLKDKFKDKGKLTVELKPNTNTGGDCPVVMEGGFTGFEHRLYRIEIAQTKHDAAYFKWSHFNGGLVGRGIFHPDGAGGGSINITANQNAIVYSGISNFYLEALTFDKDLGCWRVAYGVNNVTLEPDNTLKIPSDAADHFFETMPPEMAAGKEITHFFRLWNGIEPVATYPLSPPAAAKKELSDNLGILLQFDPEAVGKYVAGDFWTFEVRAGEIGNPLVLIANLPPQGIFYHRVPLAEVTWAANQADIEIEDCRYVFEPLTKLRGCCIEVKPGEDIHRAMDKVFEAGGGCLCLLPGEHVLRRPIDLSGRNSICIHGFGPASRLVIPRRIGTAPFVLKNARDITFESFLVVNQTTQTLWACMGTKRLQVRDVFAISRSDARNQSLFELGESCSSWLLENNVFVGAAGLSGRLLASSVIDGNIWVGGRRGIDLVYATGLQIERNQFIGINPGFVKEFDALLGDIMSRAVSPSFSGKELAYRIVNSPTAAVAPQYIAIELNAAVEIDVIDNVFYGAVGINLEVTEHCLIQRNRFLSTVAAAACGIVNGLRFSENRIGAKPNRAAGQKAVVCETGLVILADAIGCQIVDNTFENVKQGVMFESDPGNKKAVVRDYSANVSSLSSVTKGSAATLLRDSEARVNEVSSRRLFVNSQFFRIGRCERTLIQGNQFQASEVAIEWSGTKQIIDFRIVNNAFIGCQEVAIQIEPDGRIPFLDDPVDTKVRLIEKNRFDIYSGAVRSTINAVRVEKNDIRINAPARTPSHPEKILAAAAENIYSSATFTQAVKTADIPLARMMTMEVTSNVEANPRIVNTAGFSKAVDNTILKSYQPNAGDAVADKVFVMKSFSDLGANAYLVSLSNSLIGRWKFNAEGFVINLAGVQNRVVHNRLYGDNPQLPGGVLLNAVSGEVRDNEIVVPGTALLLNGKVGLSSGYQGAEVVGNSLATSGVPGSKNAVYALAIPSLSPGNLVINNNLFKGSVMIGGDPQSAQGISKPEVVVFPGFLTFYGPLKFDIGTYAAATLVKAFPFRAVNVVNPTRIVFQTDPHASRPIVQFCQNRVIQGWVGIFQALSGAYWSAERLKSETSRALIANIANNVLDYGGSAVGFELVVMGNYSQQALKYRVGGRVQAVANIPAAVTF